MTTTRLSSLQYAMLKVFADRNGSFHLSVMDAQGFDQRPFRSMLIRKYVEYRPGRGFHITVDGRNAAYEFEHREIARKDPSLPLTNYFDFAAYGLSDPYAKKRLQVVKKPA